MLSRHGYRSRINRAKPRHKAMPKPTDKANRRKSSGRARVEHVCDGVKFGNSKRVVRSVGIGRGTLRMGMKSIGYIWVPGESHTTGPSHGVTAPKECEMVT